MRGPDPAGYARVQRVRRADGQPDTGRLQARQLLVDISFTAPAPVLITSHSTYRIGVTCPRACGGHQGNSTQARIRAGTRITRSFYAHLTAPRRGHRQGDLPAQPRTQRNQQPNIGPTNRRNVALLVGRVSFTRATRTSENAAIASQQQPGVSAGARSSQR